MRATIMASTPPSVVGNNISGSSILMLNMQASNGILRVAINLPEKHHLTKGANSRFEILTRQPGAIAFVPVTGALVDDQGIAVAEIQYRRSDAAEARLDAKVYYCLDGGVCLFEEISFQITFTSACQGRTTVDLNYTIPLRESPRHFPGWVLTICAVVALQFCCGERRCRPLLKCKWSQFGLLPAEILQYFVRFCY